MESFNVFEYLIHNIWCLFMLFSLLKAWRYASYAKLQIKEQPHLELGYQKLLRGFVLFVNIPWLLMMIGNYSGATQSVFDYLKPGDLNPFVLVWHGTFMVLCLLWLRWIYFKNGAEQLETYRGLIQVAPLGKLVNLSAKEIKLITPFVLVMVWAGILWLWL